MTIRGPSKNLLEAVTKLAELSLARSRRPNIRSSFRALRSSLSTAGMASAARLPLLFYGLVGFLPYHLRLCHSWIHADGR